MKQILCMDVKLFIPLPIMVFSMFLYSDFQGLRSLLELRDMIKSDMGIRDWLRRGCVEGRLVRTNLLAGHGRELAVFPAGFGF